MLESFDIKLNQQIKFLEELNRKTPHVKNHINFDHEKKIIYVGNCKIDKFNIDIEFSLKDFKIYLNSFTTQDPELVSTLTSLNQQMTINNFEYHRSKENVIFLFHNIVKDNVSILTEHSLIEEIILIVQKKRHLNFKEAKKYIKELNGYSNAIPISFIEKFVNKHKDFLINHIQNEINPLIQDILVYKKSANKYKEINREVLKLFNKGHDKIIKQLLYLMWVDPINKELFKSITFLGLFTKKSSFLIENKNIIEEYHSIKPLYDTLIKDGNTNIAPFIALFKEDTSFLKQYFGKNLWKKITHQSNSRIKQIAFFIHFFYIKEKHRFSFNEFRKNLNTYQSSIKDLVSVLLTFKSYHLNNLKYYKIFQHFEESIDFIRAAHFLSHDSIRSGSKLKLNTRSNRIYSENTNWGIVRLFENFELYKDTLNMSKQLDLPFNYNWSPSKIRKKHEEYILIQLSENIVHKIYDKWNDIFKDITLSIYDNEKFKDINIERISSTTELAREGIIMKHCVYSYSDRIKNGNYLVFHINFGSLNSTLGLRLSKPFDLSTAHIDQHYSYCNSTIYDTLIIEFAKEFVNSLKEYSKKQNQLNNTLIDIEI